MYSRQDYLKGKCSHREYYSQFVNSQQKGDILSRIGEKRLKESTCIHFNDIPIHIWDNIYCPISKEKMTECGDYITQAGIVCTLKEAARQIVESETNQG